MENKVTNPKRTTSFLKVLEGNLPNELEIPRSFSNNFNGKIPPWFILETGTSRKCWRLDVEDNEDGTFKLTKGWNDFVQDHALELGNYLVFQYKRKLIFEVSIYKKDGSEKAEDEITHEFEFREHRDGDAEHQHISSQTYPAPPANESDRVVSADQAIEDENMQVVGCKRRAPGASVNEDGASFTIIWRELKYLQYYLTLPRAVVQEKNLWNKSGLIIMDREGKIWVVDLTTRPDGRVDLSRGWKDFVSDKKFTTGDRLTFDFLSDHLLQVSVERPPLTDQPRPSEKRCKTELANFSDATCESSQKFRRECVEPAATFTVNRKSLESWEFTGVNSTFKSSSFSTDIKMSTRASYLHIPMRVAKEQNLHGKKSIVIRDEEGKDWKMALKMRRSDGRFTINRGWTEFRERNTIGVGDTLRFKFIAECLMEVKIRRRPPLVLTPINQVSFVKQERNGD